MELAEELNTEIDDIPSKVPGNLLCQKMLKNWHKKNGDNAVVCVLCDVLYECGLQQVADDQFGHILDTVLRKQPPAQHRVEQALQTDSATREKKCLRCSAIECGDQLL
jgi:hypothetical protein